MSALRTLKLAGGGGHHSTIEQLEMDLAAFNRCIAVLEKAGAESGDIDVLTGHALNLAEKIDESRWLNPVEALNWLFQTASPYRRARSDASGRR